jgi:heme/copper-type cytochrome/quinol oxidase subunit 4
MTLALLCRVQRPSSVGLASFSDVCCPADSRRLGDFLALMKPRVMFLALFTALVGLLTAPGTLDPLGASLAILGILPIAQMGLHVVFFLHITTGPDNTNNVLALALGILIVTMIVIGSIGIMSDLNHLLFEMIRGDSIH